MLSKNAAVLLRWRHHCRLKLPLTQSQLPVTGWGACLQTRGLLGWRVKVPTGRPQAAAALRARARPRPEPLSAALPASGAPPAPAAARPAARSHAAPLSAARLPQPLHNTTQPVKSPFQLFAQQLLCSTNEQFLTEAWDAKHQAGVT